MELLSSLLFTVIPTFLGIYDSVRNRIAMALPTMTSYQMIKDTAKNKMEMLVNLIEYKCDGWAECRLVFTNWRGMYVHLKKIYAGKHTTVGCSLHLLFSESCLLWPRLAPFQPIWRWKHRTKENMSLSLSISHPPLIPPLSHCYKGWDQYNCHVDSWELSITLLELCCVGLWVGWSS